MTVWAAGHLWSGPARMALLHVWGLSWEGKNGQNGGNLCPHGLSSSKELAQVAVEGFLAASKAKSQGTALFKPVLYLHHV
jgi:hypothetical protein